MSTYFNKARATWRYDFTLKGQRYTQAGFKTKRETARAEQQRREEILNPPPPQPEMPTDMAFLELVNRRLDHIKEYNSKAHYSDTLYLAKLWVAEWNGLNCSGINADMIQAYILKRAGVSHPTANKDLRYLRATFNFGIACGWIDTNPTKRIKFLPTEKMIKYVPPLEDVVKVIEAADNDTRDYLWTIHETLARVNEINKLTWNDIDLEKRTVTLYTRKKKGGHRTPRKIPMTENLFEILSRRFKNRTDGIPWVYWHRYWSRIENRWIEGPYEDRKRIMGTLCKAADVKYFRYHAIRHHGASVLDNENVPIGSIQRLLGHENRTTTEIYLHSIGDTEKDAMRIFEQVTKKSHTDSHTS